MAELFSSVNYDNLPSFDGIVLWDFMVFMKLVGGDWNHGIL